jgi:3-hydroxyisobutyrate dehydrogenase-like beta-hydroxyacid dehydrogenase
MGAAMTRRLIAAGHNVVIWNRSRGAAEAVAQAAVGRQPLIADTPSDAVRDADVVLCSLADGDVTRATVLDPAVLAAVAPAAVLCDMGTSGVDAALALDAGLREHGLAFVDAPVSGSVATVDAGQLLVLAGGTYADIVAIRPVMGSFAKRVAHVGPVGAGQAMKLAVNLVVHDLNAALSEALLLASRAGIEPAAAYDVFQESVISAPYVGYKREAFLNSEAPVAMSLDLVEKDLRLISELADSLGVRASATRAVAAEVTASCRAGFGARDMASLMGFLEQSSEQPVVKQDDNNAR